MARCEQHVERHQPVPLRPLREVLAGGAQVVYLGRAVRGDHATLTDAGWCVVSECGGLLMFPSGGYLPVDMLDGERTLARALQPGERLVVAYAGAG